jgi:predicted SnoaL-like aldol condensation-catalyzing enzyme
MIWPSNRDGRLPHSAEVRSNAIDAGADLEKIEQSMTSKKDQIRALLKGIETGDPTSVAVVNEEKYIQHNPHTREGSEGLAALFARLSKTSPRVNIVRAFEDGDFVFAHTEYDFSSSKIGFEIFRFEDGQAIEHWDNIQPRQGSSPSGHSMVDGPTEATNLEQTETNRELARSYVEDVLVNQHLENLEQYIDGGRFTQHSPQIADGLPALRSSLTAKHGNDPNIQYDRLHLVLAEGSFVLCVSEGYRGGSHSAYYDLFRVVEGRLVEHWDTIETIPPRTEWKNDNGKF